MERIVRILIKTTTPGGPDDWSIERLSLLTEHLASLREDGSRFDVTARNRESGPNGDDPLLTALDRSRSSGGNLLGRGVAESSFHHFADYNWDTSRGAPSFVTEPEGQGMKTEPRALSDIKQYVRNLAF